MKTFLAALITILDFVFPKCHRAVFSSFPDFTDNSYAMFLYLYRKKKVKSFVWLVSNDSDLAVCRSKLLNLLGEDCLNLENVIIVKKNSIYGIYYYLSSKFVFFTHGLFPKVKVPNSHIVVNLWHGMPLKSICYLDDPNKSDVPNSTYNISTSRFYTDIISKAFNVDKTNIICCGQPRNDLLYQNAKNKDAVFTILWTPTYRKARIGYTESDGQFQEGLPIIGNDLVTINDLLVTRNSRMIIKLHPMDVLNDLHFDKHSNITVLNQQSFESMNIQVNELIARADALLTDFSSIYIDYLLLGRPIGFVINDFEKYKGTRGFIFENPQDYMPGAFIAEQSQLVQFINDSISGLDTFKTEREKINDIFNDKQTYASSLLWQAITTDK